MTTEMYSTLMNQTASYINNTNNSTYLSSNSSYLSRNLSYPPSNSSYPLINSSFPLGNSSDPLSNSSYPQINSSNPLSNSSYPQINLSNPLSNSSNPQINSTNPLSNLYPQINSSNPLSNLSYPQINSSNPLSNSSNPSSNLSHLSTNFSVPLEIISWSQMSNALVCRDFDCVYAERYREKYHDGLVTLTIVLSVIAILGAVGNTTVIVVFSCKKIKSTSIYFMLLLALTDLFVCIFVIPGFITRQWRYKFYFDALCKIWELLRSASVPISSMIMVAIACDRFFIIYLNGKIKISKLTSRLVIGGIMTFGLGLGIPQSLAMGVYFHQGPNHLVNGEYCMNNFLNMSYPSLINFWYFITAIFCGMIIVTFILYTLIFVRVYKQDIKRRHLWNNKVRPTESVDHSKSHLTTDGNTSTSKLSTGMVIKPSNMDLNSEFTNHVKNVESFAISLRNEADPQLDNGNEKADKVTENKAQQCLNADNLDRQHAADTDMLENKSSDNETSQQHVNCKQFFKCSSFGKIEEQCYDRTIPGTSTTNRKSNLGFQKQTKIVSPGQQSDEGEKEATTKKRAKSRANKTKIDSIRRKSIHWKTTQILFTVTIVYIASFLPIFLMSYDLIPQNKIIYYMYFFNNVANPIIYSFMNKNFRADVRKVLLKCERP